MEGLPLSDSVQSAFISTAIWHGPLDEANAMLKSYPELAHASISTAAILGDAAFVGKFLSNKPTLATETAEPYGGNALVYLCMSKYLRLENERSDEFLTAAKLLLDAGADPDSGFWTAGEYPEFETALYGAAGIAHHRELTRMLLAYGADPNDGEAVYHSPETYENGAMMALVETGRITQENLALMLIRKHDFHDYYGVRYLLEQGADPDWCWGDTSPFHQALRRDNHIAIISLLLDRGARPDVSCNGLTVAASAAREGRGDVLREFQKREITYSLDGIDLLIAACALGDDMEVDSVLQQFPELKADLIEMGGNLLARFAGTGNTDGCRGLLRIGVKVDAPFTDGDNYYGIPKKSLAIHVAAWRARPEVIKLLLENNSPADTPDANGHTPLQLAVKACTDSYWTERRNPDSVRLLTEAGARPEQILSHTGYDAIDAVLFG